MPERIAIIGSGRIGQQWAALFASGGYEVCMHDVDESRLETAVDECRAKLVKLESEGLSRSGDDSVDVVMKRVKTSTNLADTIKGAIYVQECVFEDPTLKKSIFAQLDALIDNETTVVASSTSAMQPSAISEGLKHKSQCLVAHPIMPPVYVPLVELVPAPWTSPSIVDKAYEIMTKIGQSPIRLHKELPGFAVGTMQYAVFTRAWQLVCDGVLNVEDVDKVLSDGFGMRYAFAGPIGTLHLNADGIAHHQELYGPGVRRVCESSGMSIPPLNNPEHVEDIANQMEQLMPLAKINEWRAYREKCLAALGKLKKELEKEKPTN